MVRKLISVFRAIRKRLEMNGYNDFTIAEHFRSLGAEVGKDCRLLIRTLGSEPWLVRIGNHVTISFNVTLLTHDGATWIFTEEIPSLQKFGPIEILDNCFIGAGATIMPGVRIGPNSVVGAGALVTKTVPPNTIVAGIPARTVSDVASYKLKVVESWAAQRPQGYLDDLVPTQRHSAPVIHEKKREQMPQLRSHLRRLFWPTN
jgi:acetyltransferase-like isoleucine patch superfamily enzyme